MSRSNSEKLLSRLTSGAKQVDIRMGLPISANDHYQSIGIVRLSVIIGRSTCRASDLILDYDSAYFDGL